MSKDIVADFNAFLSVAIDGDTLLETREGRVVMTREDIAFADEETTHRIPLEGVAEFDFRTVPEEWEQFFDDLVGVRFDSGGEETTVTIGTDTEVADRFVTALLKLLLDDTEVAVRQRHDPVDGGADAELHDEETTVTLLPKSERLCFDTDALHDIGIETVTGVERDSDGAIIVRHLDENGRLGTEITPETARDSQFLRTYLEFRSELTTGAGPVNFLFVGEDRDGLVLVAKLLKHRNLAFEAAHVTSGEEALDALDDADVTTECVVAEYDIGDMTADELRAAFTDAGHTAPMVCVTDEDSEAVAVGDQTGITDVVELGSRTEHYEDIADAIERAVLSARVDA